MKYRTIYIDPPWKERGCGRIKRGADRHYPLMTVKQIMALPVPALADDNCHLYIWTTNNFMASAFEVIKQWGFKYITAITWVKARYYSENKGCKLFLLELPGLGQYFRGMTEHCLFCKKGHIPLQRTREAKKQTTVIVAPRGRHSEKPEQMRRMIEIVSYAPRLEMFARGSKAPDLFGNSPFNNWHTWGNEIANDVELKG